MERVNQILRHPLFREKLAEIDRLEENRIFCRHGLEHLLSVARLAYLRSLEEGLGLDREQIYAAALLHDIGRGEQYLRGTPHDRAGAVCAEEILTDCGFSAPEREAVAEAISGHRSPEVASEPTLRGVLYRADKESRLCFCCPAAEQCNWPEERRSKGIRR
ncbi:MAG: HD domain-containing protein [Clostridiales bacterium]|nr:HD domain-containing protein [Clostridiales bacterium]